MAPPFVCRPRRSRPRAHCARVPRRPAAIFILYAWYMYMWRSEALKAKVDHLDDRVGPSLFVVCVLGGMAFVGYKKLQQAEMAMPPY